MAGSAFDGSRFGWKLLPGAASDALSGAFSSAYEYWLRQRGATPTGGGGGGAVAPVNTVIPTISGSMVQGQVLTATTGTWTGFPTPTYTYQWQRCDASGLSCSNIGSATSSTYTLVVGDVGSTIVVVVTATNTAGTPTAVSVATAVVVASSGGGGGGTLASSVTSPNGLTWTFDKPYPTFVFNNGDVGVAPNSGDVAVTIISDSVPVTGSGASTRNGWMVNPSSGAQCYDGRAASFLSTAQHSYPYASSFGTSIVKAVSLSASTGTGANVTFLDKAAVLTVLSSVPATDAFRPPYYGSYKPIFTQSQLATGSLPSKVPVGSPPTLAQVEGRFQQVQLDHVYSTVSGRPNPLQSFHAFNSTSTAHVYGENLAIDNCEAILRVCLNDTLAAKQNSINYLVQAGIDWYGIAKAGTIVAANGGGGHQGGRKIMVAFAGWLLGDSDVQAVAAETTGGGFGEKQQFYWSASAGGASSHFTGQGAGMALFGYINFFTKPFPYDSTRNSAKDIRDSTGPAAGQFMVDGGLSCLPNASTPNETSASYDPALYAGIASAHAVLACTIIGIIPALRTIFNYDYELFYADRLWDFGWWTQPDGGPTRPLGAPVAALHGTQSGGAALFYGSSFGNAMRTAYRGTSLFTGP